MPGYNSSGVLTWKIVPDAYYLSSNKLSFSILSESARLRSSSFQGSLSAYLKCENPFIAPVGGSYTLSLVTNFYYCEPDGSLFASLHEPLDGPVLCFACDAVISKASNSPGFSGALGWIGFGSPNSGASAMGLWEGYFILTCIPIHSSATYNTDTRQTSISGNYGIIGDNGQITKVEDNSTIVNEINNTYYTPVTGTTSPISDWSYNYADRSYTTTTESGDTEPALPTCTWDGSAVYVCSLCGESKTEILPALGHTWEIKQSVTTQYDESGNLI